MTAIKCTTYQTIGWKVRQVRRHDSFIDAKIFAEGRAHSWGCPVTIRRDDGRKFRYTYRPRYPRRCGGYGWHCREVL